MKRYLMIVIIPILLSSCASLLNPKFQKIKIITDTNTLILIDGQEPEIKKGKYLIRRDAKAKQITLKKEGYKDENIAIMQHRKSPYHIMSWVPFAITIFPPFYDSFKKSRNYLNEINLTHQMKLIPNKEDFAGLIELNDIISITDVKSITDLYSFDNKVKSRIDISYRKYLKNKLPEKKEASTTYTELKKININNLTNKLFMDEEYIKNIPTDLKLNKLSLNMSINNYTYNSVETYFDATAAVQAFFGQLLFVELDIKWEILNENKDVISSYTTKTKSGEFAFFDSESEYDSRYKALSDAINGSFIDLTNSREFKEQISQRNVELKKYLAENQILDQNHSKPTIELNYPDTIYLKTKGGDLYLSKKDFEFPVRTDYGINKKSIINLVEDVPKLHSFAIKNIHGGTAFTSSLASCYNDYILTGKSKELNQDYFYQFGLITKKEWKNGPSPKMLGIKKPISGEISQFTVTTTHYVNSMPTTSTTGESYRFKFMYGNAEYKKGFLLKNLSKAMGQDVEARKHIRKYRANFVARTSIFLLGAFQVYSAINWAATDKAPFGLSTGAGIAALAPGLIFINWFTLFPQNYKTINITNAINTYNRSLK